MYLEYCWQMPTVPTPLSALTDLAEMCEEAAAEMFECETESEAARCARDYLHNHVQRLADDVYAICPNTLFCGEPIVLICAGQNDSGPIYKPARSLRALVAYAVSGINIWHGDAADVSGDFQDAAWIIRDVIARVGPDRERE